MKLKLQFELEKTNFDVYIISHRLLLCDRDLSSMRQFWTIFSDAGLKIKKSSGPIGEI